MIISEYDKAQYEKGWQHAKRLVASGYPLDGDGPHFGCEAFFNGFIDYLSSERNKGKQK